ARAARQELCLPTAPEHGREEANGLSVRPGFQSQLRAGRGPRRSPPGRRTGQRPDSRGRSRSHRPRPVRTGHRRRVRARRRLDRGQIDRRARTGGAPSLERRTQDAPPRRRTPGNHAASGGGSREFSRYAPGPGTRLVGPAGGGIPGEPTTARGHTPVGRRVERSSRFLRVLGDIANKGSLVLGLQTDILHLRKEPLNYDTPTSTSEPSPARPVAPHARPPCNGRPASTPEPSRTRSL